MSVAREEDVNVKIQGAHVVVNGSSDLIWEKTLTSSTKCTSIGASEADSRLIQLALFVHYVSLGTVSLSFLH